MSASAQVLIGALIAAWAAAGAEPVAAADSVTTTDAGADSVAVFPVAGMDSVAVFPVAGADSVAVFPDTAAAVAALPDSAAVVFFLPPTALAGPPVPGQPLAETRVDRDETERTGAHTPFQLLGLLPAQRAVEVCGTTAVGALATRGSFGAAQLEVDGWTARLPRLEGRDLAALLLDRLGPHAGLSSYAALGSLRASGRPRRFAPHRQTIALRTVEPASESGARSRVTVYTGDFDLTGGGVTLSDRRGRLDYKLGVMNGSAGRSGALESMSTRLAMIDLGWLAGHGRWSLGTRNGERNLTWKSAASWRQFDQTARLGYAHRDSTGGPEWSLHLTGLDDRLSGSEFPAVEFRRRGLQLGGTLLAQRSRQPLWARLRLGRDWFSLRSVSETLAPRVERGTLELGTAQGLGDAGTLSGSGSWRVSSRHPARWGGGLAWRLGLGAALHAGAAASRTHRAPTFDQEVLDLGPGPAEPERTDAVELWIEHGGRWSWNVSGARRHLAGVPFIERQTLIKPWPLFRFRNRESAHWEVAAGALSPPVSRWQVRVGAWASRLVAVDGERRWSPAFIPDYLARAYLTAVLSYFADDLRLRPRVDLLLVGRRDDFSGGELASYVRLDGTLTAVMSQAVDLELTLRNLTDERYPLPVMQPGGELYRDSGQQLVIGLRWRLLD